jgi:two-component system sensor histidine kinase KdpD
MVQFAEKGCNSTATGLQFISRNCTRLHQIAPDCTKLHQEINWEKNRPEEKYSAPIHCTRHRSNDGGSADFRCISGAVSYATFMNDGGRPNPDALLAAIQSETAREKRGHLKVFLGMCAGVGKTYAMLESARRELAGGKDVVIAYLETHGRKETDALAEGLPLIKRRQLEYRGVSLSDMDLDAVLARHPRLALVDEFAHTNAPDSRHPKRYQDVAELLDAGIDVFTTLNVQHIESRADAVRQITGTTVQETVPDTALVGAELELVDLPPEGLRERLAAGKVYLPAAAAAATDRFFRPGNLAALRELVLRFTAERVGQEVRDYRIAHGVGDPWKSGQRLLVAVSPSPSSASLVRWTRRLAGELHASWVALNVEPPQALSEGDQTRLTRHLALARELGAEIITTTDNDIVHAILRIAREQNATQIVVGKPAGWRTLDLLRGGSMLNRLIRESGRIDVHAVAPEGESNARPSIRPADLMPSRKGGYAIAAGAIAAVTVVNTILQRWIGHEPITLVYLMTVIVLAMYTDRGPTLAAATATALMWDYFFTEPRYNFKIEHGADVTMFATYFIVAVVMGQLASRLRAQQTAERQRERRATALYLLTRELAAAPDLSQLLAVVIRHVGEAFRAEVAVCLPETSPEAGAAPLTLYFASTWAMSEKELNVAVWAFQHRQSGGRGTDSLALSEGLHLPLIVGERAAGTLSLRFQDQTPLAPAQRDLLDAFVRQIALVLDRLRLSDAEVEAKLLTESERLGTTLLNSVSHELRTPLAAISSAASNLRSGGPLNSVQQALTGELDVAAERLNRLVDNLLDVSRLEAGHLRPALDWHDLGDIAQAALKNVGDALAGHTVKTHIPSDLPPVKLDAALMVQVLSNLLANAARHTPPGTTVEISARIRSGQLVIEVADNGPGLPSGDPSRLFDRFQRGPNAVAGGTGLGLSLVKGFTEAQGGQAAAASRPGGGSIFTLTLPLAKVPPVPEEKE